MRAGLYPPAPHGRLGRGAPAMSALPPSSRELLTRTAPTPASLPEFHDPVLFNQLQAEPVPVGFLPSQLLYNGGCLLFQVEQMQVC